MNTTFRRTSTLLLLLLLLAAACTSLYWAPDSSALVVGAASGYYPEGIIVVPLDRSGAYRLVAPGSVRLLGWLPDGRIAWVATTGGI